MLHLPAPHLEHRKRIIGNAGVGLLHRRCKIPKRRRKSLCRVDTFKLVVAAALQISKKTLHQRIHVLRRISNERHGFRAFCIKRMAVAPAYDLGIHCHIANRLLQIVTRRISELL